MLSGPLPIICCLFVKRQHYSSDQMKLFTSDAQDSLRFFYKQNTDAACTDIADIGYLTFGCYALYFGLS